MRLLYNDFLLLFMCFDVIFVGFSDKFKLLEQLIANMVGTTALFLGVLVQTSNFFIYHFTGAVPEKAGCKRTNRWFNIKLIKFIIVF